MYNPAKPYKSELLKLIQGTWDTKYVRVREGVYPVIRKKFSGLEIQHTDGIGTKGAYHWQKRTFKEAVNDALAMNLNDLAMAGATPYALADHITVPEEGHDAILKIIRALTSLAKKHQIAIVGGETSHHDNADGLDISIIVSGFLKELRKNYFQPRDVLIGLKSSGLHSNGFTKVRSMFGSGEWRDDFVRPTKIYSDEILRILRRHEVHGMMHITGGAFTKLRDLLKNADAEISVPASHLPQPIFHELFSRGVSDRDMYTMFNCGVGFVLSVPEHEAKKIVRETRGAAIIGKVVKGNGKTRIESAFSNKTIEL